MAKTVYDYFADIAQAKAEIAKLQAACLHNEYELCMWSWRPGASYPSRICKECHTPLPGITDEEAVKAKKDSFKPVPPGTTIGGK